MRENEAIKHKTNVRAKRNDSVKKATQSRRNKKENARDLRKKKQQGQARIQARSN